MREEQARASALAARQTLARDMHDVLAHSLGGLVIQLDAVEAQLEALARSYVQVLRLPHVLQLRRLLIGEAGRFPELARGYYERVPQRVMLELAAAIEALAGRGLLRVDDAALAASHLAFLIIGPLLDRAMFGVPEEADQEARRGRLIVDPGTGEAGVLKRRALDRLQPTEDVVVLVALGDQGDVVAAPAWAAPLDRAADRGVDLGAGDGAKGAVQLLAEIQAGLYAEAKARLDGNIRTGFASFEDVAAYFGEDDDSFKGWVRVSWSKPTGAALEALEQKLKALKLTIRNAPEDQPDSFGPCVFTGVAGVEEILIGRAY